MRLRIIAVVVRLVLANVSVQMAKEIIDDLLDKVEDACKDRPAALESIAWARKVIDVPDDIGGDED